MSDWKTSGIFGSDTAGATLEGMREAVAADAGTGTEGVGREEAYLPIPWDGSWNFCSIGSGLRNFAVDEVTGGHVWMSICCLK